MSPLIGRAPLGCAFALMRPNDREWAAGQMEDGFVPGADGANTPQARVFGNLSCLVFYEAEPPPYRNNTQSARIYVPVHVASSYAWRVPVN
jgi:hypothetical protein